MAYSKLKEGVFLGAGLALGFTAVVVALNLVAPQFSPIRGARAALFM